MSPELEAALAGEKPLVLKLPTWFLAGSLAGAQIGLVGVAGPWIFEAGIDARWWRISLLLVLVGFIAAVCAVFERVEVAGESLVHREFGRVKATGRFEDLVSIDDRDHHSVLHFRGGAKMTVKTLWAHSGELLDHLRARLAQGQGDDDLRLMKSLVRRGKAIRRPRR